MQKKTVVIVYEYFFPGYKAGGPIQSLVNMVAALQENYDFKVITTAYDLHSTKAYPAISVNSWNEVILPGCTQPIQVWYAKNFAIRFSLFRKLIQECRADIVYINGLFTQWFSKPLLLYKLGYFKDVRMIVSPRGMLQQGALQVKPFKKKVFLKLFNFLGLFKKVYWHATNASEKEDIVRTIHKNYGVYVAENIPKSPVQEFHLSGKEAGKLRLVYLSLITEKKNLLYLIEVLSKCSAEIHLSIYGPVKDLAYWQLCEQAIEQLPQNISVAYKGAVVPAMVQPTIQQYDAFVSLTKGENFGHAIFEAFSCGRPVLTSNYTPWSNLEHLQAGWNVSIEDSTSVACLIDSIAANNMVQWNNYCENALQLANAYFYEQHDFKELYKKMFH